MSSAPYPFTAAPSSGSNSSPPVNYPQRHAQRPPANSSPVNLDRSQQRGYYAQSPSNSPSTTSLLPASARGPPVQATFAQGPKTTLKRSNSDTVRRYLWVDNGHTTDPPMLTSTDLLIVQGQYPLFRASLYQTRQVVLAYVPLRRFVNVIVATTPTSMRLRPFSRVQ